MTDKEAAQPIRQTKKVTPHALRAKPAAKAKSSREAASRKIEIRAPAVTTKTKHKLVRDSFTIPKSEYVLLEGLKGRATNLKHPTKKSELLRAGIAALHGMSDRAFLAALDRIPSLKTGRPKGAADAMSQP